MQVPCSDDLAKSPVFTADYECLSDLLRVSAASLSEGAIPVKIDNQLSGGLRLKRETKIVSENLDTQLMQLDRSLEQLRHAYDQYFAGVSKRPPQREHDLFRKQFTGLPIQEVKTTSTKFKHQTIKSRYLQLQKLWDKTLREIEEGTHRRELFLLKARESQRSDLPSLQTSKAPDSKSVSPNAMEQQLQSLYERYSKLAAASQQKVPQKEAFVKAIQGQIAAQKAKNPKAKIELKLQKDEGGKFQIKLSLKSS